MATDASGRSMEKLATLDTTSVWISPVRKASKSFWRTLTEVSPLMTGAFSRSPSSSSWSMYWPITSSCSPRWCGPPAAPPPASWTRTWRRAGTCRRPRPWRRPRARPGQVHADLHTVRGGDVALGLDVLPRRVIALGSDQAEDLALPAVFAHQCCGEAQPSPGLQVRRHPEDRGGQQVDLVVDDQAPVVPVHEFKVRDTGRRAWW
jgi:hypothetical protein